MQKRAPNEARFFCVVFELEGNELTVLLGIFLAGIVFYFCVFIYLYFQVALLFGK